MLWGFIAATVTFVVSAATFCVAIAVAVNKSIAAKYCCGWIC